MQSTIKTIKAREILGSYGNPTVEVRVELEGGKTARASVPSGASTGSHEALELRDNDLKRYGGKGVLKAVENVNKIIAPALVGRDANDSKNVDKVMIELDGTENKSKLGANAILPVSLALAEGAAKTKGQFMFEHIREVYNLPQKNYELPKPMMVVIEGGRHADNSTDLQEYLITPIGHESVRECIRYGEETYRVLREILKEKGYNANVGNEGAYAPTTLKNNEEPLKLIVEAIKKAGYEPGKEVAISLDPACSEIYKDGKYFLAKVNRELTSAEMIDYFSAWIDKYPIITLEDALSENDWDNWPILMEKLGGKVKIIGDDLTVTNVKILQRAIDLKAVGGLIIKLNQIGTLSETVETARLAHENNLITIVSHRGCGETNDAYLIDLAVAVGSAYVKVGPARGERVCKYNRLMEIEENM